jgi:hypothetical protein
LQAITSIGGEFWIDNNPLLTDLSPFENLISIGVNFNIINNASLTNLSGLENINPNSIINLNIYNNTLLSFCAVQSICDNLLNPNGTIIISNNASGCNSQQEVEDACEVIGDQEINFERGFTIFPNPCCALTIFAYQLEENTTVTLTIFNHLGSEVKTLLDELQYKGNHSVQWNFKSLPAGTYYCQLKTKEEVIAKKIIKL